MLGTVTPLGERARGNRYSVTAGFLIVGAVIGGVTVAILVWMLRIAVGADPHPSTSLSILFVASLLAVLIDLKPGASSNLGLKRQVSEEWVYTYKGWAYGLGFGIQLGAGVLTIVSSAQILLALLAASIAPTLGGVAMIGGLIGVTRGAPVLMTSHVSSPDGLITLGRQVEAGRNAGHWVVVIGGALVSIVLGLEILGGAE